jgi:hypothetical protein
MGNIKRSATMGRFGKNPNMKKEVVLSTVGTKSNSCRGEAASYWKKGIHGRTNHAVPVSRWSSGGMQYKPMAWSAIGEGGVVNQTTQQRISQVEGSCIPAQTLTCTFW